MKRCDMMTVFLLFTVLNQAWFKIVWEVLVSDSHAEVWCYYIRSVAEELINFLFFFLQKLLFSTSGNALYHFPMLARDFDNVRFAG